MAYAVFTLPNALKRNQILVEQKLKECELRIKEKELEDAKKRAELSRNGEPEAIADVQSPEETRDQQDGDLQPSEDEPKKDL